MTEDADFNQQIDEFKKITTELDSLELKVEQDDKALSLLASLPSTFDNIVLFCMEIKP